MATNANVSVEYILFLANKTTETFRKIWHFDGLKIAKSDEGYWLKGLNSETINRSEVRSMLGIQLFELRENLLFSKGNLVPERKMPTGLLWHPIRKALAIELPSFNENLFEIPGSLSIDIVASDEIQKPYAFIVQREDLKAYVDTVPEHYFNTLEWCLFGDNEALLIGVPIVSIVSKRFWKHNELLIPVGFDFQLSFLKEVTSDLKKKTESNGFWLFDILGSYAVISKENFHTMSRSSVKRTLGKC